MFTRASAALLFPVQVRPPLLQAGWVPNQGDITPLPRHMLPPQHIDRWAFDVELLYLAARKAIPMVEVPVTWCVA